ncbi:hypothetical protein BV25DRAFT_1885581 [Artomyces pyxidatus]|uniref:Uncharacterized protein n=1 Tax=Artomyces pyxidatus TaxID=48021 RepID=A0ACB8T0P8_9AGAM|nr:hypothetical protein BV25DRAFT_1885581 [Artomyces pyxidatus]
MSPSNSPLRPPASRSRVRRSRSPSPAYHPIDPDNLAFPQGGVDEETVELIHEFVHPHHHEQEETLVELDHDFTPDEEVDQAAIESERAERSKRPWWRRATPWWYVSMVPFSMAASMATMAPRIEILTDIVCDAQRSVPGEDWDPEGIPPSKEALSPIIPSLSLNTTDAPLAYDASLEEDSRNNGPLSREAPGVTLLHFDNPVPCAKDPSVQAGVATLLAVVTTTQGVLSCITTGFWSSLSDRYGRTFVLGINVVGLLITELSSIVVFLFPRYVPGGYWAIAWGSAFEGFLGGRVASMAAMHAYLADTTDSRTRSRIFSLYLGLFFVGLAVGPTAASFTIHLTGKPMIIFYVAVVTHFTFALLTWFVVPESVLPTQMKVSRATHATRAAITRQTRGALAWAKSIFSFLSPLSVFAPMPVEKGTSPQKVGRMDWSLTFLALAYGPDTLLLGAAQYIFQFASASYGWNSEMNGYWLSIVGVTRASYLAVGLPLIINVLTRKPAIQLPVAPSEPLDARSPSPAATTASRPSSRSPGHKTNVTHHHTPAVDLTIARVSLVVQAMSYAMMIISPSSWSFIAASALGSLGAGFSPTVQSLALELYMQRGGTESGKLFGALSVVQALGSQIIGPSLFGLIYVKSVATTPQLMFFALVGVILLSLFFVSFVRLPNPPANTSGANEDGRVGREETLVEAVPLIIVEEVEDDGTQRGRQPSKSFSTDASTASA